LVFGYANGIDAILFSDDNIHIHQILYFVNVVHIANLTVRSHVTDHAVKFLGNPRSFCLRVAKKIVKLYVEDCKKELTCSICCDIFTNPKALPCMHSYCTKCIVQWYERSGNQVAKRFNCPICKARSNRCTRRRCFKATLFILHCMALFWDNQEQATGLPDCVSFENSSVPHVCMYVKTCSLGCILSTV
jgi:hypothetical protein